MHQELADRVAVVTGGSQGIGAAVCIELARQGCDVALTYVGKPGDADDVVAAVTAAGRQALPLMADSRDAARTDEVFARVADELGDPDILVCNAGITRDATIWSMTDDDWRDVIDVNLTGYFHYVRAAARVFRERRRGRIVNVASINGLRGKFGQANYTAAKGGVIALTKTLARELGKYGVTVNAVAPGMVATEMAADLPQEFRDAAVAETVLRRLATPKDIADVIVFLCTDRARHVTGEIIKVDGGQYI